MYGLVAVESAQLCNSSGGSIQPKDAWEKTIKKHTNSASSQKKGCPRNIYLGFYASKQIIGCPEVGFDIVDGSSVKHEQGKQILKALQNPENQNKRDSEIWKMLFGKKKSNREVNVVRALRDAKLLP